MLEKSRKRTALLSVYNKDGIIEFAQELVKLGWTIIASGGTATMLNNAGVPVKDVSVLVGGKAILGHRVVTLSREIHAGLLASDSDADIKELESLGVPTIDLVCVDLYPLKQEITSPKSTPASVIEKTDIGGPTLLRSAAKGRRIVICRPADRQTVIDWLKQNQPHRNEFINALAARAEAIVAEYCLTSAAYHSGNTFSGVIGEQVLTCKYGENGWLTPASLYQVDQSDALALSNFQVIAGSAPSYNNLCDVDRLLQTVTHIAAAFDSNRSNVPYIAVAVKHGNPCGAAVGTNRLSVLRKTIIGDTRAIFGGLVMTNFPIGVKEADTLLTYRMKKGRRLLDGIIAPSFTNEAVSILSRKGDKCRFLANPALGRLSKDSLDIHQRFRYVRGGFLSQPNYTFILNLRNPDIQKYGKGTLQQRNDLLLGWAIGSTSNSNTITLVRKGMLLADAVGQQDRVGACQLAVKRATDAGHTLLGATAYSDSFFPFIDGPETLARAGISAIFASSGSVKDPEVINFCQKHDITLYMIPDGMGRGFFGH